MTFEVRIPPAGEGIAEVMVQRWEKQVGEQERAGEVLLQVESEKATVAVEAQQDGWLLHRLAAEGEVVAVGAAVAVLGDSPAAT
jgi:pyruvate/2-oxoglutarate dehydrogenase complex dihydrolipoamide acyltransferase (E2) component